MDDDTVLPESLRSEPFRQHMKLRRDMVSSFTAERERAREAARTIAGLQPVLDRQQSILDAIAPWRDMSDLFSHLYPSVSPKFAARGLTEALLPRFTAATDSLAPQKSLLAAIAPRFESPVDILARQIRANVWEALGPAFRPAATIRADALKAAIGDRDIPSAAFTDLARRTITQAAQRITQDAAPSSSLETDESGERRPLPHPFVLLAVMTGAWVPSFDVIDRLLGTWGPEFTEREVQAIAAMWATVFMLIAAVLFEDYWQKRDTPED